MNTFFEEKSSQNVCRFKKNRYLCIAFERDANMVAVVQLVRASDCGSECRRFESGLPPPKERLKDKSCKAKDLQDLFFINTIALWKTTKN